MFHTTGNRHHTTRALATAAASLLLATGVASQAHASTQGTPGPTAQSATATAAATATRKKTQSKVTKALQIAASLKGRPYRWGATGPNAFDCSGYTKYVMAKVGKKLPRTTTEQYRHSRHRTHATKKVGDLIFAKWHGQITHVGIYAGHNMMWHSPYTGARVRKESLRTAAGPHYLVGAVLPGT